MTCTYKWKNAFIATPCGCASVLLREISAASLSERKSSARLMFSPKNSAFRVVARERSTYNRRLREEKDKFSAKVSMYYQTLHNVDNR